MKHRAAYQDFSGFSGVTMGADGVGDFIPPPHPRFRSTLNRAPRLYG